MTPGDTWRAPVSATTCRATLSGSPGRAAWKAGAGWRHVPPAANHDRIFEMLVQVIDVLDHAAVHRARDRDVVEHRQVLHVLAQPDAAGMRADRHAESRGEQDDRQVFVDPAEAATVDLAEVN